MISANLKYFNKLILKHTLTRKRLIWNRTQNVSFYCVINILCDFLQSHGQCPDDSQIRANLVQACLDVIKFRPLYMRAFSSFTMRGRGNTYTLYFLKPHKKKATGCDGCKDARKVPCLTRQTASLNWWCPLRIPLSVGLQNAYETHIGLKYRSLSRILQKKVSFLLRGYFVL